MWEIGEEETNPASYLRVESVCPLPRWPTEFPCSREKAWSGDALHNLSLVLRLVTFWESKFGGLNASRFKLNSLTYPLLSESPAWASSDNMTTRLKWPIQSLASQNKHILCPQLGSHKTLKWCSPTPNPIRSVRIITDLKWVYFLSEFPTSYV